MFFFKNSVRSAVVKVIDTRIKEAQNKYESSMKDIIAETKAKIIVVNLESETKKQKLMEDCVNSVISNS